MKSVDFCQSSQNDEIKPPLCAKKRAGYGNDLPESNRRFFPEFVKKYGRGLWAWIWRRIGFEKPESYREYGAGFFGAKQPQSHRPEAAQLFFHKLPEFVKKYGDGFGREDFGPDAREKTESYREYGAGFFRSSGDKSIRPSLFSYFFTNSLICVHIKNTDDRSALGHTIDIFWFFPARIQVNIMVPM